METGETDSKIVVEDHFDVASRARELGIAPPQSLAILPRNFADAGPDGFQFAGETPTVRKLFRAKGIEIEDLADPRSTALVVNKSAEWVAPTLFISAAAFGGSGPLLDVAVNVLSDHITHLFQRTTGKTVKFEVVVEGDQGHPTKKITYEGDVSGLKELPASIRALTRG